MVKFADDVPDDDAFEETPPFQAKQRDIQRWNKEWGRYLVKGWERYLAHHSEYPETPKLPDDPKGLIGLLLGPHSPLEIYCDREWIEGQRMMELGCGCGTLGKLLARYAKSYLGVDFSTLALQVGRIVSPSNCTYVQSADAPKLEPFFGNIDTVISRHFWIHQNLAMGQSNLDFYQRFVRKGGRVYLDFFRLDPSRMEQDLLVLPPTSRLSKSHPSATFQYEQKHLDALLAKRPFKVLREEVHKKMQRWYVVLERV